MLNPSALVFAFDFMFLKIILNKTTIKLSGKLVNEKLNLNFIVEINLF